jgi:hypothetical protein
MNDKYLKAQPLETYVKGFSDYEIMQSVSRFKSTLIWRRSTPAKELHKKLVKEWTKRHGGKPIPSVLVENDMVFVWDKIED